MRPSVSLFVTVEIVRSFIIAFQVIKEAKLNCKKKKKNAKNHSNTVCVLVTKTYALVVNAPDC